MDENTPLVSVILPTYNRASLLEQTIESVLSQTYENLEVIVVNDGSTDETEAVVRGIDDSRVKYHTHKQNKGANAARNTGLAKSNGEYVAYIDSDVMWLPEKIAHQVETIERADESVGGVYCKAYGQFENYLKEVPLPELEGNLYKALLGHEIIMPTSQLLFKTECFESCGNWDTELPCFNEYDLSLRIAREYDFAHVSEPLVINLAHDETSISRNIEKRTVGTEMILEKWGEEMKKHHGEAAVSAFERNALKVSYRTASIWNAKRGRRRTALRQAYKYLDLSGSPDLKYFGGFFLSLLDWRIYDVVKRVQYQRTGVEQDQIIQSL